MELYPQGFHYIIDNDPGIGAHLCSNVFNPFFTTKPVGEGTGLGLSISRQAVTQKHQGTIDCLSSPGEGAQFVVRIPVQQSVAAPTA